MSWTRCCWLTTKVTTKARTSGRFWECYRGSTARQPVFLMCCHTTRTRFTKAATGIDCEGRWHSCLCKRSSGFNLTKKNDFFLLYSQIWVPSLVHAQDQLANSGLTTASAGGDSTGVSSKVLLNSSKHREHSNLFCQMWDIS